MHPSIEISPVAEVDADDLLLLYSSVGWGAYTRDPDALARAVANSTYVVTARSDGELVGLARGLSDDVSIFYLQDILVRPEWQHQGIGRALLSNCLEQFGHVRSKVLMTDDLPEQHLFYEALGYADTRRITNIGMHTFVQMDGIEIETD